jgi:pimeloyl-ACP methyl ester carboxylesterase
VQSSQLTWWRLKMDLQDLGWQVHVVDMLGHGSRHAAGPGELTIDDLAQDVLAQIPGPVNVLAGHSLGSIVALTLIGLAPEYCDRVVVEDPLALADRWTLATSPTTWKSLCGLLVRIPPGPSWRC